MAITIGIQLGACNGDMGRFREAWIEADEMGVDRIYTSDHFFPPAFAPNPTREQLYDKHFEAMSVQAAMAVTTKRAEIGCLVVCNSYRNPNLLADMARTIDHLSGGRYVLGIGSGWWQLDYDEYGYPFGTAASRLKDLERDLPIIKARLEKLNPPPLHNIPIMIGGGGEKMTLKLVAQYADEWHFFGDPETMKRKCGIIDDWCAKFGRNPAEIARTTVGGSFFGTPIDPEPYIAIGFTHFIAMAQGPDWDLTSLKELVAWKKARQ